MWWLLLTGCILGPKPDTCEANADCRDAFGFGYSCGAEGYCLPADVPARCDVTYPADVFENPSKYTNAVVVGTIYSKEFDDVQLKSTELAFRQYAGLEASDDNPVAMVHCDTDENVAYDDLSILEAAGFVATFMARDLGLPAIIGPSTSDESFSTVDAVSSYDTMVVSPSATSAELTTVDGGPPTEGAPGYFWRTVPPDDLQAFAIAEDMAIRGVDDVFVIYQDTSYGRPLATAVFDRIKADGRSATLNSYTDFGVVGELLAARPNDDIEILFISSASSETAQFLTQIANSNHLGNLFFSDAAADQALLQVPDGDLLYPRIRGTRPQQLTLEDAAFEAFVSSYAGEYVKEADDAQATSNAYAAYSYDAGWMVLFGAEWARAIEGKVTGEGISRSFLHLSDGEAVRLSSLGFATAQSNFAEGNDIDVDGSSGQLEYDAAGEVNNPIEVWTIVDDDFLPVRLCEAGGECQDL